MSYSELHTYPFSCKHGWCCLIVISYSIRWGKTLTNMIDHYAVTCALDNVSYSAFWLHSQVGIEQPGNPSRWWDGPTVWCWHWCRVRCAQWGNEFQAWDRKWTGILSFSRILCSVPILSLLPCIHPNLEVVLLGRGWHRIEGVDFSRQAEFHYLFCRRLFRQAPPPQLQVPSTQWLNRSEINFWTSLIIFFIYLSFYPYNPTYHTLFLLLNIFKWNCT